jgi:hypothetical protein
VLNGKEGSGYAVYAESGPNELLPSILRRVAKMIEPEEFGVSSEITLAGHRSDNNRDRDQSQKRKSVPLRPCQPVRAALRFSLASIISTTNELSVVLSVVLRRVRLPVIRTYNRPVAGSFFGPKVANGQPWAYVGSYVYEEKSVF